MFVEVSYFDPPPECSMPYFVSECWPKAARNFVEMLLKWSFYENMLKFTAHAHYFLQVGCSDENRLHRTIVVRLQH